MNSYHRMLGICAIAWSIPACSAEAPDAVRHGSFQLPLLSTASSGRQYHLSGVFQISGAESANLLADGNTQAVEATLRVGSYTVTLASDWQLDLVEEDGSLVPVEATLVSPNPQAFEIQQNVTTEVAFAFQTQGDSVVFGTGSLRLVIDVQDQLHETSCTDGLDNDADGLIDCADPECAPQPACVSPVENCTDGLDNDGDGLVDCADADCAGTPACPVAACGDGVAEAGEFCFSSPESVPVPGIGPSITLLASANFNSDGLEDLVAASSTSVEVLLNSGSGFDMGPPQFMDGIRATLPGNFSGDGTPDLAVVSQSHRVQVFDVGSAGELLLLPSFDFPVPLPTAAGAADLNGDSLQDLVVSDSGRLHVLLNTGGGFILHAMLPVFSAPRTIAIADFDSDGDPDIAVALSQSGQVPFFENDGAGGFVQPFTHQLPFGDLRGLAAGDVNADGLVDLVVSSDSVATAATLLNMGGGGLGFAVAVQFPTHPLVSLDLVSLDHDEQADLLGASAVANRYLAFEAQSDGFFHETQIFPAPAPRAIIGADISGDGFTDIIVGAGPAIEIRRSNP